MRPNNLIGANNSNRGGVQFPQDSKGNLAQSSTNDWEWEKDNYLIKDIKELVADSAPQSNSKQS